MLLVSGATSTAGSDAVGQVVAQATTLGFTGHEHLDNVSLIHMNGRLYDPNLGRFTSADPVVKYPESTQGYNRYSYAENNPLSRVDLNGYSWLSKNWKMVVIAIIVVVLAVITAGAALAAFSAWATTSGIAALAFGTTGLAVAQAAVVGAAFGAVVGAAVGYEQTRNLKGAIVGAVTGAVIGAVIGAGIEYGGCLTGVCGEVEVSYFSMALGAYEVAEGKTGAQLVAQEWDRSGIEPTWKNYWRKHKGKGDSYNTNAQLAGEAGFQNHISPNDSIYVTEEIQTLLHRNEESDDQKQESNILKDVRTAFQKISTHFAAAKEEWELACSSKDLQTCIYNP